MPVSNYYKILFLPKWYPNRTDKFSGIFIEKHAKAVAKNCKTAVLFVGADGFMRSTFETEVVSENNIKVVRVYYRNNDWGNSIIGKSIKFLRYLRASYKGLQLIKSEFGKPNLVHVNVLTRPGIIALLLKKLNNIPFIITEHWTGYMPADGSYKGFLKRLITKLVVNNARTITTVSKSLEACMKAQSLLGNYTTVSNIVEIEKIPKKIVTNTPKAIIIGNLEDREKNITPVIKAIAALVKEIPALYLTIVGSGIDQLKLEKLVKELALEKQITFLGRLPNAEVYELIASSSFVIINSNYETFSVVAAEALACGTPVIATKSGGPEEFINDDFGKIIPIGNFIALKEAIKWMCSNYDSFDKEKMKKFALENFNENIIANKFIAIYDPIISKWKAGNSRETLNIPYHWKVVDVGSGDHPNERADVLLERELEATEHRSGAIAVVPEGKELVLGDATQMPFANKQFDYVIASHIAEHIDKPEKFCLELQRVAKRGYLETPGAFSEFIFCEPFHYWVVTNESGVLTFTQKIRNKSFSEWFYRFYYLNEKRTDHKAMYSNNIVLIKFVNLLRRSWKYIPKTYTKFHWETQFEFNVIRKSPHA